MFKESLQWAKVGLSVLVIAGAVAACGGGDDPVELTPTSMTLEKIGGYDGGALGAAEITAFDASTARLFVVNGANGTVDVLDLRDPRAPKLVGTINVTSLGAGVNSVAVHDGLVALAIEASPKTNPGV
ncbi:MAG: choice-of-anchor I domain-containing protein, partial [Burkholderiaceae bacterium]